ncbi:MAG: hypothetical protein ACLP5E_12250 [Streptosporangiaceae bacterium]
MAAATCITDHNSRAEALAGLAPHLPADERPGVLAQALTAATAITGEYIRSRAEVLTNLAPQPAT